MQCKGFTAKGEQCKRDATDGDYCKQHAKEINGSENEQIESSVVQDNKTHKSTRPWDADNNPWARDMLKLKKEHKGFKGRFITKDPENIEKYLDQGYKIADKKDYGGLSDNILGESDKIDTRVKRRELILVEIPNELYEQRKAYIDYKTNKKAQESREMAKRAFKDVEDKVKDRILLEDRYESHKGPSVL